MKSSFALGAMLMLAASLTGCAGMGEGRFGASYGGASGYEECCPDAAPRPRFGCGLFDGWFRGCGSDRYESQYGDTIYGNAIQGGMGEGACCPNGGCGGQVIDGGYVDGGYIDGGVINGGVINGPITGTVVTPAPGAATDSTPMPTPVLPGPVTGR